MAERMTQIERLARDICWAGFIRPSLTGTTKAAYWRTVDPERKREYIGEANRICWLMRKLGPEKFQLGTGK